MLVFFPSTLWPEDRIFDGFFNFWVVAEVLVGRPNNSALAEPRETAQRVSTRSTSTLAGVLNQVCKAWLLHSLPRTEATGQPCNEQSGVTTFLAPGNGYPGSPPFLLAHTTMSSHERTPDYRRHGAARNRTWTGGRHTDPLAGALTTAPRGRQIVCSC